MEKDLIFNFNILNFFILIISFFIFILIFRKLANIFNLLDQNDYRKIHYGNIPLIGGITIYSTLIFNLYLFNINLNDIFLIVFYSSFIIIIIGILDDMYNIPPYIRLLFQIISITIIINSGLSITSINYNGYSYSFGIFGYLFTTLCLVTVINAYNFIDGIDGLCSSIFLIPLSFIMFILFSQSRYNEIELFLTLFIIVFIFLILNLGFIKSLKIFLGDNGSTFLGFILGCFLIYLSEVKIIDTFFVPWLIAIPIYDLIRVIIYRLVRNINPTNPDRIHLHHILNSYFNNHHLSLIVICTLSIILILYGYIITELNTFLSLCSYILFFLMYFYIINLIEKKIIKKIQ